MARPAWMDPAKIQFITIHCSASPRGRADTVADITRWDVAKFGQVSYHYVIELDGKVTQTLQHDQRGAHVANHNTGNIGICYVGGVEKDGKAVADTRTIEQKRAMAKLVRELKAKWPRARVLGHRDWSPDKNGDGRITPNEWLKGCPSFDVATWLKEAGI